MYGIGNISATLTDILIPNAGIGDVPYLSDNLGKTANQRKRNNVSAKEFAQIFNSNILNDYPVTPLKIDIKLPNGGLYTAIAKTLEDAQSIAYKEYVLGNPFFIRDDVDTLVLMFDYDSNGKPYFANEHTYMLYMPKNIDYQTQEKFTIKKRRLPKGEPFLSNKQAAAKKAYDNAHKIKPTDVFRLYTEDSPRLHFAAEKVAEHLFDVPLTRSNIINVIDNMQLVMDLPGYQVPSDDEVLETIKTRIVDGLGKPTIKLEFETNSELADFLSSNKQSKQYAPYTDVTATETPTAANAKAKSKIRNGILMPADDSSTFPEPPTASALPPSPTTPKSLPPSSKQPTPGLPSFNKVFKNPDGIYFGERRIGDYGTINDNLRYINLYIDKNYGIARNIFIYAEKIFPNAVVVVCFVKDGKWKFYLERKKYQDAVRKYLPKFYVNGVSKYIVIDDIPSVERLVKAFEADGKNVVLIYRNIVDDINDVPSTPVALPPSPTTPTNPNAFDTPDWDDIYKRLYDSYHWNSFDPENSATYSIKEFKNLYAYALDRLPEDRKQDFTTKFVNYVYEIARLNAAAPSAAVTGRGGISAKQAAKYNAANDRYMEKRAHFTDWIKNYIDKANRIEQRQTFVAMSQDQKEDARFEEIKKNVDYFAALLRNRAQVPSYSITNARQNLQSKIENEAYKGNVELVERLLEYMRPLNVYTNRSSVWTLADVARKKREKYQAAEQKFEEQNNDENADYQVYFDTNEDRVKIYFNSIPSEQIRSWLKSHNFKWSPRNKAWQRQITTDSRYVVNQFNELYKAGTLKGLGKPTIKLEFEDNADLMSLFDTDGINGFTVNDKPADIFNCPESALQTQGYKPTYRRLPDYSHLIDSADGRKTLKGYGFDRATLDELINACKHYPQVARLADHLKDPAGDPLQSAFNVWHWLHTNIRYAYDTPGEEEIRTPARVWADRESGVDCDCLAVMTACLLLNMGLNPQFEIVAFNNEPTFSHIYVNLDGAAIDRVLPVFLARPDHITKTQIMDIPVYQLSGIGGCDSLSGVYSSTLAKLQQGTATGEDINDFRKTQVLVTLRGIDDAAYSLAALLMPHVVTIADDGTYYFDSTAMAQLATKLDHDLADLISSNADADTISQWIAAAAKQIDGAASVTSNGGDDTIVVIINPKGATTRVIGQMVKSQTDTLTPLTQTATATDTAAQTYAQSATPAIMQTSAMPGVSPDGDTANEESDSNNWLWFAGIAAAFGIGAAVASNKKKRR